MAADKNYSFYKHNLRTPAMQSFNRGSRLLQRRGSAENKLVYPDNSEKPEESHKGVKFTGFVPHPPSSPRSAGNSPRSSADSSRGRKGSRYNSPKASGSEDEKKCVKPAVSFTGEPLPPLRRHGSSDSVGSVDSNNSSRLVFLDSPLGTKKRGLEPLRDFGSDKELVNDFKSYQQAAKCNSPGSNTLNHKPVKVNTETDFLPRDEMCESGSLPLHSTPVKSSQEPASALTNGMPGDDEDTLSCSDDSLTSVSGSDDDSLSELSEDEDSRQESRKNSNPSPTQARNLEKDAAIPESQTSSSDDEEENYRTKNKTTSKLSTRRDPNSTLPTLPAYKKDDAIKSDASGIYDSIHPPEEESCYASGFYDSIHPSTNPPSGVSGSNDNSSPLTEPLTNHVQSNSASDLRNITRAMAKISTDDTKYASDSEFSRTFSSQLSNSSQSSSLPRVDARTVRMRNQNFLSQEMERYIPDRCIGIFVATWNMHEEKGVPFYLDDFLIPESVDFLQDVYVIGAQEATSSRKEWEIKLQETLGPSHVMMHSCSFGVLHLAIFIRRELVWFCSAVSQGSIATRPGHMIKTKGALAAAFSLFGTSFLFINSHFTSDEGKVLDRVNDYNTICKSLSLSSDQRDDSSADITTRFDRVFWLGDFNFRVDMERSKVDKLIETYQEQNPPYCKELLEKDQLLNLMKEGKVFKGFQESSITFLPSYKHDLQSDTYDSSSKMRIPSWTDRVLYRTQDVDCIKPLLYDMCTSVKTSDHRPVLGIFEVKLNPCKNNVPLTGGQYVRDDCTLKLTDVEQRLPEPRGKVECAQSFNRKAKKLSNSKNKGDYHNKEKGGRERGDMQEERWQGYVENIEMCPFYYFGG